MNSSQYQRSQSINIKPSCSSKDDSVSQEEHASKNQIGIDRQLISQRKRASKYAKIDQQTRVDFIKEVLQSECTIKYAADKFNINFSTAKAIIQLYKREGRIGKKQKRIRKKKLLNQVQIQPVQHLQSPSFQTQIGYPPAFFIPLGQEPKYTKVPEDKKKDLNDKLIKFEENQNKILESQRPPIGGLQSGLSYLPMNQDQYHIQQIMRHQSMMNYQLWSYHNQMLRYPQPILLYPMSQAAYEKDQEQNMKIEQV